MSSLSKNLVKQGICWLVYALFACYLLIHNLPYGNHSVEENSFWYKYTNLLNLNDQRWGMFSNISLQQNYFAVQYTLITGQIVTDQILPFTPTVFDRSMTNEFDIRLGQGIFSNQYDQDFAVYQCTHSTYQNVNQVALLKDSIPLNPDGSLSHPVEYSRIFSTTCKGAHD